MSDLNCYVLLREDQMTAVNGQPLLDYVLRLTWRCSEVDSTVSCGADVFMYCVR